MLIQTLEFNVAMVTMSGWSSLPPPLAPLIQARCSTTRSGVILSSACNTVTSIIPLICIESNMDLQPLNKASVVLNVELNHL